MLVARAILSSVRVDGWMRPLSRRATTACVVSMRSANLAWVRACRTSATDTARAFAYEDGSQSLIRCWTRVGMTVAFPNAKSRTLQGSRQLT